MKKLLTVMLLPLCVVGQRAYAESSSDTGNIAFADMEVKAICVQNWDTDGNGELSYAEAAVVTNLGRAFKDNAGITTFNELQYFTALEKISGQAFYNCSSLTSVTLPPNVKVIDQNAFYATGITSIELPASVTTIADAAFNGNANLSSITVSEGNTVYDSRNGCNGVIETSTNTLVLGCKNTVIPDGVTIIGSSAYRGCTTLTSIIVPKSVTAIGASAFRNCTNLTSAIIPSSVTNIEADAFLYCYNLSSITVGRSVPFEWTSGNTFSNLANATLYVPAGSKSAYESAAVWNEFKEIVEIENIAFADSKVKEVCVSNWDTNGDGDLSYAEAAVVKSLGRAFKDNAGITTFNELQYFTALEKISGQAFYNCSSLTSVTLSSNVKVIDQNAFYATGITSIELPASVTTIADAAFNGNANLSSITVSEGNTVYDSRNGCNGVIETSTNTLVLGCKNTVIPDGVAIIGSSAFRGCTTITSIIVPKSVTAIGANAFRNCTNLTSAIIPSSVANIEADAFLYCYNLSSITVGRSVPFEWTSGNTFSNLANATLYVPAGSKPAYESAVVWNEFKEIVEIENIAFADSKVKEVCVSNWDTNGDGDLSYAEAAVVTTLGKAFKDNAGITTFNELQYFTALEKISGSAFSNCSSLTSVTLPSNVKVIEMNAFYASGIISIEIPASVDSIAVAAFNSCHALESITVEEGNSVYDSRNGCEAIIETATNTLVAGCKNTVIPNDVTAIGGSAFRSYETLTSINIPESVTSIATDAFYRCNNLTTVIVNSRTPLDLTNGDTFYYRSKATLYVPAGSKTAYENAAVWSEFKEIVEMEVPENMFVLNNMTLSAGQSALFPVALNNGCEVTAFQCDICLPEGITLQQDEKGKYDITLDENRADDHTITSALQEDGSLRIVVASLSSSVFSGTSGNLFYLNLFAENGLTGEHKIALKNIHISEFDGTRHDLNDTEATITIQAFTPADVNNDGLIAVDDVVLTINGALGITADNFLFAAADMNADGQILVDDVVQVINSVLGISTANVMTTRSTMLESLNVSDTEGGFKMNVTNAANYVAMQFDMMLPEGVSLDNIQVTSGSNHAVATCEMEHGVVRVIVSSLTNDAFRGDQLLNVGVFVNETATIRLTNAYVATCGGTLVSVSDAEITRAGATGIHGIEKNATPANIYDLSGRLVKENATSTEGLQKGIYLMNGKKVVVK